MVDLFALLSLYSDILLLFQFSVSAENLPHIYLGVMTINHAIGKNNDRELRFNLFLSYQKEIGCFYVY